MADKTLPHILRQVTTVVRNWTRHAWGFFVGPQGYLVFISLIGVYAAVYSIVEARHERRANRALFERSNFMTMVASGNRGTFIAAMKTFGPVQTIAVPRDPELFAPWTWFEQERPNEDPLHMWAVSFFPLCTADMCGNPDAQPKPWRIDLTKAELANTYLLDVDLRDADLYNANLRDANLFAADFREANLISAIFTGANLASARLQKADLRGAWLRGANLTRANLHRADLTHRPPLQRDTRLSVPHSLPPGAPRAADLTGATLHKTRLQGVDLREVYGLTQGQLNSACVDDATQLPDGFIRPAPCL
jgi:hypothetical protein